jgi:phosphoribosylanthranilate isomerase
LSTKIKICGVTREQDADAVVSAGADAIGLNFVPSSARYVTVAQARSISEQTAGALRRVGVFADPQAHQVEQVLARVDLDVLQFHGNESREECERWGLPYIKAVRMRSSMDATRVAAEHPLACCLLLDTYRPGVLGGTGERFDLALWPRNADVKLALAGGLDAENVAAAIAGARPYAVDVSGGVEGATQGEKSPERIKEFVNAVRHAE